MSTEIWHTASVNNRALEQLTKVIEPTCVLDEVSVAYTALACMGEVEYKDTLTWKGGDPMERSPTKEHFETIIKNHTLLPEGFTLASRKIYVHCHTTTQPKNPLHYVLNDTV